jgi:hypothetical protein
MWCMSFAFGPYAILMWRGAYASIGDIPMLPFLCIVTVTGPWLWMSRGSLQVVYGKAVTVVGMVMCLVSVSEHLAASPYQGVEQTRGSEEALRLIREAGIRRFHAWSLFQDPRFNTRTIQNVLLRDPIDRARLTGSVADLTTPEMFQDTSATDRYRAISSAADVLLHADRQTGPMWLSINREWSQHDAHLHADNRFIQLGTISPYDDGTQVEIWAKARAHIETATDGWMVNGALIQVLSSVGQARLVITGMAHGEDVADLSIVEAEGRRIVGTPCIHASRCFEFILPKGLARAEYTIESTTPTVPAVVHGGADRRQLLLHLPVATMEGSE